MKTERLYIRIDPQTKGFLQEVADVNFKGNLSALFDYMIENLKQELEGE
jgi:hypothetical protein